MTNHESEDRNNSDLFAQVAKVYADAKARQPFDFSEIQYDLDILDTERQVVTALADLLPKYTDIKHMLAQNDAMKLMEAAASLQDQIIFMPNASAMRNQLENVEQTLRTCMLLANEVNLQKLAPNDGTSKRIFMRRILSNGSLFEDEKIALMQLTDSLLSGQGIDTSDPDDVLRAINENSAELERDNARRETRDIAAQKVKGYLAGSYSIKETNPKYDSLVNSAAFHIAAHVDNTLNEDNSESLLNSSVFPFLLESNVTALGVDMNDITAACSAIAQELIEANQAK